MLCGAQLPAPGRRRLRLDYHPGWRICGRVDRPVHASAQARARQGVARVVAAPGGAADGAGAGAGQLSRKPRHLTPAPRHGQRRPARVDLLYRARTGPVAALWLLCRCLHAPDGALRRRRAHRSRCLPRHRKNELRPECGAAQRSAGGDAVNRLVCVVAVLCCGWAADGAAQGRPGTTRMSPLSTAPRTLVVPFDNLKREGRIFWLGEASAVLLTDDLNAVGTDAITRQERLQAFERLQVPPVAALTDGTVIRIGQLVGAARVVVGSLQMVNDVLVVRARSITLDTGRVQVDVTERGPLPDLFKIFERIARRIAPSSVSSEEIARQQPTVAVLEDFIKGLLAEPPAHAH